MAVSLTPHQAPPSPSTPPLPPQRRRWPQPSGGYGCGARRRWAPQPSSPPSSLGQRRRRRGTAASAVKSLSANGSSLPGLTLPTRTDSQPPRRCRRRSAVHYCCRRVRGRRQRCRRCRRCDRCLAARRWTRPGGYRAAAAAAAVQPHQQPPPGSCQTGFGGRGALPPAQELAHPAYQRVRATWGLTWGANSHGGGRRRRCREPPGAGCRRRRPCHLRHRCRHCRHLLGRAHRRPSRRELAQRAAA